MEATRGRAARLIDAPLRDAVYEAVRRGGDARRAALLREFNGEARVHARPVAYGELPALLGIAGLDICGMYALTGVEVRWPTADAERFARALAALSRAEADAAARLSETLAPELTRRKDVLGMLPTARVEFLWELSSTHLTRGARLADVPGPIAELCGPRGTRTIFPTADLPLASEYFGVSLYWLLGQPPGLTVLTERPELEAAVSNYLFMPPRRRLALLDAAEAKL